MKYLLTISFAILSFFPLLAQQKAWISLYDQTSFDLDGTVRLDTLNIPLKLESPLSFREVTMASSRPLYVRLNNKYMERYIGALQIHKSDSALQVIVDMSVLTESGTYQAMLIFSAPGRPQQELPISFNRPAAKLDTVNAITINIDGNDIKPGPFMVKEMGKLSDIGHLTITPPLFPGFSNSDIIVFSSEPRSVKAGGIFTSDYHLNDRYISQLPLGRISGTVEINAPELSSSLSVPIEIINKRSKMWIILVTFTGILLGVFVRTYLKNRRLLQESKVKGYNLIEQIENETSGIKDQAFKDSIDGIILSLGASLKNSLSQQTLESKITDAVNAYNTLKKTFDDTLSTVNQDIKTLITCFSNFLSPFVLSQLKDAQTSISSAQGNIKDLNPTDARANIDHSKGAIKQFITTYTTQAGPLIAQLSNAKFLPNSVPPEAVLQIKENADKISKALQAVNADSKDVMALTTALGQIDTVQSDLEITLKYIVTTVIQFFNTHSKVYGSSNIKAKLKKAFTDWKTDMEDIIKNPYQTLDLSLVDRLSAVSDEIKKKSAPDTERSYGPTGVAEDIAPYGISPLSMNQRNPPNAPYLADPASGLATISIRAARSRKSLFWINAIQVFFLSLILGLIFYKTYGPTFIGTTDELITLFLFGFSVDVTVDSVMQLSGKGRVG